MRVLIATVAAATLTLSGTQVAAADEKPAKAEKICKTVKLSSSRMPKRTCKTAEQWQLDAERASGEDLATKNDQYRVDNTNVLSRPN